MASQHTALKKSNSINGTKSRWPGIKGHSVRLGAVVVVAVLAVSGGTVAAADSSKPGDALYGVDRGAESLRLALSLTDGLKEASYRDFAAERVEEMKALLEEDSVDAEAVAQTLADFEAHKHDAQRLAAETEIEHEQEVEDEFEGYESEIDKIFEDDQRALENQRENLKARYEAALKAGDSALVAELRTQIDAVEPRLKDLEDHREASKQEQEEYRETLKDEQETAKELEQDRQERLREAIEKEVEAQEQAQKEIEEQQKEVEQQETEDR